MSPALSVRNLTRRFGALVAVDDVSFDVPNDAVMAVIGPNGAGKSTLFNLITGVVKPDAGEVALFGNRIDSLAPHARARLGLARTFQAPVPFPNMTVLENVMVGMRGSFSATLLDHAFGTRRAAREEAKLAEQAVEHLHAAGLKIAPDTSAAILTAGQQRLLAIARALGTQPKVLLLDEPAAGLNEAERETLAMTVAELGRRRITVLLIEHAMDFVMGLVQHIVVLDYGRKLAEGTPAQITNHPEVIAAYLGVD